MPAAVPAGGGDGPLPAAAAVHRALQSLIANGLVASHRTPPSLPPEGLALREEYQARSPGAAAAAAAAAAAGPHAPQHRAPPGLPAGLDLPPPPPPPAGLGIGATLAAERASSRWAPATVAATGAAGGALPCGGACLSLIHI